MVMIPPHLRARVIVLRVVRVVRMPTSSFGIINVLDSSFGLVASVVGRDRRALDMAIVRLANLVLCIVYVASLALVHALGGGSLFSSVHVCWYI